LLFANRHILLLLIVHIRPKTKRFRPLSSHPQCQ